MKSEEWTSHSPLSTLHSKEPPGAFFAFFTYDVEPRDPARPLIEIGLARRRAVILVRIHVQRRRLAVPLQRVHHADRADRIRADVLIFERVIHQQRAAESWSA